MATTPNPFEIFGFQEEKAHVGFLAWLVDTDNEAVSSEARQSLIGFFLDGDSVSPITKVVSHREYSFGRRLRIDLVIEVRHSDPSELSWIVIEAKTDSDMGINQLEKSREAFESQDLGGSATYIALLLGAGRFTGNPSEATELGWRVIRCDELFSYLNASDQTISKSPKVIGLWEDWLGALKNELDNHARLPEVIASAGSIWNQEYLRALGYRTPFPVFYSYYEHLRQELASVHPGRWEIYSGSHNAVMTLIPWLDCSVDGKPMSVFWEFNDERLKVKALLTGGSGEWPDSWDDLRDRIADTCLCGPQGLEGKRAARRKAKESASIFSWQFDFGGQSVGEIAQAAVGVLKDLVPEVEKVVLADPNVTPGL